MTSTRRAPRTVPRHGQDLSTPPAAAPTGGYVSCTGLDWYDGMTEDNADEYSAADEGLLGVAARPGRATSVRCPAPWYGSLKDVFALRTAATDEAHDALGPPCWALAGWFVHNPAV